MRRRSRERFKLFSRASRVGMVGSKCLRIQIKSALISLSRWFVHAASDIDRPQITESMDKGQASLGVSVNVQCTFIRHGGRHILALSSIALTQLDQKVGE